MKPHLAIEFLLTDGWMDASADMMNMVAAFMHIFLTNTKSVKRGT
jgi:hypothetical protein